MSKNKFLITQSLLSSYDWIFKKENGYEDFIKTLERKTKPPTQAMLNGQHFENLVTAYCNGSEPEPNHKWIKGIKGIGDIVQGGAFQVRLSENISVDGIEFVLYGILDVLKSGIIYDIKYSSTYTFGKYLDSPQHPMYFALCPESVQFTYLVYSKNRNKDDIYKETYYKNDVIPIEQEIKEFMNFLDKRNLVDLYAQKWKSRY